MSLATLVDYAQLLGRPSSSTTDPHSGTTDTEIAPSSNSAVGRSRPRPDLPDWIRNRRPEQEAPRGQHGWLIRSKLPIPLPPPDVDAIGPDALAFYVPFHFYRDDWGIYVRDAGVKYLAYILKGASLRPGDEGYLKFAESILLEHEWWHAATEIACTRAEIVSRCLLYHEYFQHMAAATHEEALANAHAIRRTTLPASSERATAERWMQQLGPGYRDFRKWLPTPAFGRGQNVAVRFMTEQLSQPAPKVAGAPHQFLFRGAIHYTSMPVRRVVDLEDDEAFAVRPFPREHGLQVFVYSNDHEPPHFHIKLLANDAETRYLWPALVPYDGNRALTGAIAKSFGRYWKAHEHKIVARLRSVYPNAG